MASNALARSNGAAIDSSTGGLSQQEWEVLKNSICKGFSDIEATVFAGRCQAMGLSPLSGQITAFRQGGGVIPIVTIDGYRAIASRIDPGYIVEIQYLIDGQWVDYLPDEAATQARALVWRTGQERPVIKAVSRKEFAGNSNPWRTMPNHMLAKVAESHALRMAYPQSLAGTYSSDEITKPQQATVTDITPPEPPKLPSKSKKQAPIATLSKAQLMSLSEAMNNMLSDVGREAFLQNVFAGFGVESLRDIPAEHFDNIMKTLGNPGRVNLWNEGRDGNGNQVVSDERIAELAALASDPGDDDQLKIVDEA